MTPKKPKIKTIQELLDSKGNQQVWFIQPDATIYEALQLMAENNVGALPVIEDSKLVGILSERDYAREVIEKGWNFTTTKVNEIMTTKVMIVRPEQTIDDCMRLMTYGRFRHLPVVQDEKVVGMVSIRDIANVMIW
jgi:CBS domain-containing protein